MGRHARHNTNAASFTYHERQQAKAISGTQTGILGRDSMKDFDACSLCLLRARDPRICAEGHVYCQECILTNLLSQKKDIKRQSLLLERMRADSEAEMAASRAAARDRVLHEFESAQSSLGNKTTDGKVSATGAEAEKAGMARGTKRSFQLDEDEIERLTNEATEEALRRTTQEMAEARKAKLPNYWLPSLTPSATPDAVMDVKLQPLCQASKPPHPISLKSLTEVKFTQEPRDKNDTGEPIVSCPSCRKTITNNVKSYVLKACGDVLCSTCVDTLCRTDKVCAHCGTAVDKKKPYIELRREGTGYASGGGVEVKRYDVAFQA
ncbi:hypothetical protein BMF94_3635 [Rhodotorula taiwanensis]|uniref:Nitric oxide synthase-interacting protein zinc-finger domain-containing protein n=1 Tax=Rhodotorula taiwanensis TaxID=741276 RepID=A0A2S5B9A9_9BASI|nr:hypothetical protein BMF94_3635 [Rhodotorula taiwanensis]